MNALIVPLVTVVCAVIFGYVSIMNTNTNADKSGNSNTTEIEMRVISINMVFHKKIKLLNIH